jgi:D-sedoheptulose 7-phosphate isomerase
MRTDLPDVAGSGASLLAMHVRSYVEELTASLNAFSHSALASVVDVLERARRDQRRIFIIGNGGSAATASHMACDLAKGTVDQRNPEFVRFRALSLSDNTALITALGNDLSFEAVFSEQLAMVMNDGDVVVFISASGNSPNLVRAAEYARSRGAETVALLGFGGGTLADLVDVPVVVSSRNYGVAEDFHLIVQHVLTQYLRRALSGPPRRVAFLDRDGVINERLGPHEYVERWEQFRFVPGVVPMLRGLAAQGYELVVITNQQGVGKGVMSAAALHAIHEAMTTALAAEGLALAQVLHCPHVEADHCFCRKPRPGLIYQAMNASPYLTDLPGSILIGEARTDMLAGRAAGICTRVYIGHPDDAGPDATAVVGSVDDVLAVVCPSELKPALSS